MYVSTKEGLDAFCELAARERVVAVDTEFIREKTYFPRLCLVQVAAGDAIAAVDPILIDDLGPLAAIFEDASVTKVLHSCTQDLEVILDGMGCACAPVFDTQLAAAFLGMRQQCGLGDLVRAYCGVTLPKADSLTDWARRPLDAEQLAYAEDDVRYLVRIYDRMMAELVERDRLAWLEPEMAELCDPARVRRDPREAYLRLRRAGSLTRSQLAIAREVCAWREATAARHDIPRKWVVSDEVIVEVCKRAPTSVERLRRIRGTDQLSERDARELVAAVRTGRDCPAAECPEMPHRPRPTHEADGVIDLMYAVLRVVSERSGVATQLIATRDDLLEFMQDPASSRLSSGWRWELAGSTLERLLQGQIGLTVKKGRVELL